MIIESENKEKAIHDHKLMLADMEKLIACDGWKRIDALLKEEIRKAYVGMVDATTSDAALKASTAYVIMKNILGIPEREIQESTVRLRELTAPEVEDKPSTNLPVWRGLPNPRKK